jgi:hypothetical protein
MFLRNLKKRKKMKIRKELLGKRIEINGIKLTIVEENSEKLKELNADVFEKKKRKKKKD